MKECWLNEFIKRLSITAKYMLLHVMDKHYDVFYSELMRSSDNNGQVTSITGQ